MASASNKLLSNIQDVVSNVGKNVGAPAGSGEDLLNKIYNICEDAFKSWQKKKKCSGNYILRLKKKEQSKQTKKKVVVNDSDEDDINTKLKKFDKELRDNYLLNFHPRKSCSKLR